MTWTSFSLCFHTSILDLGRRWLCGQRWLLLKLIHPLNCIQGDTWHPSYLGCTLLQANHGIPINPASRARSSIYAFDVIYLLAHLGSRPSWYLSGTLFPLDHPCIPFLAGKFISEGFISGWSSWGGERCCHQGLISVCKFPIKFINKLDLSASFFGLSDPLEFGGLFAYTVFSRNSHES